MKMRYRMPSLKTMVGVTKAKRQIKGDLGIYGATRVVNAPTNAKREVKRSLGWETEPMKILRFLARIFR